jgi:hypothetical protein
MEAALTLWIVCGLAAGWVAQTRGASIARWFLAGVILGPLGIVWAFIWAGRTAPPWLWRAGYVVLVAVLAVMVAVLVALVWSR